MYRHDAVLVALAFFLILCLLLVWLR